MKSRLWHFSGSYHHSFRRGTTLLELAIVMMVIGFSLFLLIPALLKANEESREQRCSNRLRKIMRGVSCYERANGRFPPGRQFPDLTRNGFILGGYTSYSGFSQTTEYTTGFYSVHVWILPYVDQQDVYKLIDFERAQAKQMLSNGQPYNINYDAYSQPMPLYLCPSDPNTTDNGIGENNYRYNFGGEGPGAGTRTQSMTQREPRPSDRYHPGGNGAFTIGEQGLEIQEYSDGLSRTVFFSERTKGNATDPLQVMVDDTAIVLSGPLAVTISNDVMLQGCLEYTPSLSPFNFTAAGRWPANSDYCNGWPFAGYDSTEYNHVAPPNWEGIDCGVSFIPDTPAEHAIIAARSLHRDSVNVAFGDGSVKAIKDDVDLTLWRAIGTRNGAELLPGQRGRPARRNGYR
ncbi:DUF1559 family PulG-like putative transporter [Bythopirellula goksoeyrii]|nr:DUF1559 domain-containing protein [Bythopirellula goksoeyrii]